VLSIFTSADVAVKTIKGTAAVRIQRVVIQEPGIPPFGFVQDCFGNDLYRHKGIS